MNIKFGYHANIEQPIILEFEGSMRELEKIMELLELKQQEKLKNKQLIIKEDKS